MMPLKIEILENQGSGFDVTVLGIGEAGKTAIREYPCPAYGGNHWAIQTLTLCDDDAFQHKRYPKITTPNDSPYYLAKYRQKICEVIKNSDILFVIADISKDPDYENAFRFANLHRSGERKVKYNILVDCSAGNAFSELTLSSVFDLLISHRSAAKIYRPVEMILSNMYTQMIGVDFVDVQSVIDSTPRMKFFEERVNSKEMLKEIAVNFDEKIAKERFENDTFNAFMYFSMPCSGEWDIWDEAYQILHSSSINGNIVLQIGLNADKNDETITFSLIVGREYIDKKERESDEENKDLLTEF
jgi:hypothetical protein